MKETSIGYYSVLAALGLCLLFILWKAQQDHKDFYQTGFSQLKVSTPHELDGLEHLKDNEQRNIASSKQNCARIPTYVPLNFTDKKLMACLHNEQWDYYSGNERALEALKGPSFNVRLFGTGAVLLNEKIKFYITEFSLKECSYLFLIPAEKDNNSECARPIILKRKTSFRYTSSKRPSEKTQSPQVREVASLSKKESESSTKEAISVIRIYPEGEFRLKKVTNLLIQAPSFSVFRPEEKQDTDFSQHPEGSGNITLKYDTEKSCTLLNGDISLNYSPSPNSLEHYSDTAYFEDICLLDNGVVIGIIKTQKYPEGFPSTNFRILKRGNGLIMIGLPCPECYNWEIEWEGGPH